MTVKLSGFKELIARVTRASKDRAVWDKVANDTAQEVLKDSNAMIPLEYGDLQESGIIERSRNGVSHVTYTSEYALRQHEDLTYQHPGMDSSNPLGGMQGQAKFLEKALKKNAKRFKQRVTATKDNLLRGDISGGGDL
jgi:hypothetical protein